MLVAQEALRFTETMIAEFGRPSSDMRSMSEWQARYVAIVAMLRAVGHIFHKVDCDTPDRKRWANAQWKRWQEQDVFREFIDPARNELLKEFQGGLRLDTAGIGSPAFTTDPSVPGGVSTHVAMDYDELRDGHDRSVAELFRRSIAFWQGALQVAECEWGDPS